MQQPGWFPDPSGRFEFRFWNGTSWTDRVARGGVEAIDPPAPTSVSANEPTLVGAPVATESPSNSPLHQRGWRGFRGMPLWVQALIAFFAVGLLAAPFVGDDETELATLAAIESTTTASTTSTSTPTSRPATTAPTKTSPTRATTTALALASTTTAPATTAAAPTTTTAAPTTVTAQVPTTATPTVPPPTAAPTTAATAPPASPPPPPQDLGAAPCEPGQIKGNNNSGIYHAPGQRDYAKTYANVTCYDTEAEAVAAGFRRAQR